MEVVCVIDLHRYQKRAFEDVENACISMNNVMLTHIQVRIEFYYFKDTPLNLANLTLFYK